MTHEVRPGETASGIAAKYGVTTGQLLQLNEIERADLLITGRQLRIPTVVPESRHRMVVLQPGDTLWRVAKRNGVSVASLQRLNRISDPTKASAGMRLRLPGSVAVPGTQLVEVDALMASADTAIRAAEFERAGETVGRAKRLVDRMASEPGGDRMSAVSARRARVEVAAATIAVAYGEHGDAVAHLGRALRAEPGLEMDLQTTSPKLLRALRTARLLQDDRHAGVFVSAEPR